MKFYRKDLLQRSGEPIYFNEAVSFDLSQFHNTNDSLRDLKDVEVDGMILFDLSKDELLVSYTVTGNMIVACSITSEDVPVDFMGKTTETYRFGPVSQDEEIIEVKTDFVDISLSVFQTILFEVPLYVVKPGLKEYPKGDGWAVLTEKEYRNEEKPLDPRLAKLREFKVEE